MELDEVGDIWIMTNTHLSQIGQIAVPVDDLDRAVTFYRDTLGMRFLFQVPGMAFFDCGGVRLMLALPEGAGEGKGSSSVIYYQVDDIHDAFRALSERGATIEGNPHLVAPMQDHDLWMAFFKDSEDNLFALMSEIPRP